MNAEAAQWKDISPTGDDSEQEEHVQGDAGAGEEEARRRAEAFGDLAFLAMQHPIYRNFAIADLDWLIGNVVVMRAQQQGQPPVPLAAIIWARVSEEVDERLMENLRRPFRLSPEEYVSGDIYWIAHTFGPPQAVEALLQALTRKEGETEQGESIPPGPLAGKQLKQRVYDDSGRPVVMMLG